MKCPVCLSDASCSVHVTLDLAATNRPYQETRVEATPRLPVAFDLCITCSYRFARDPHGLLFAATAPRSTYPEFKGFISAIVGKMAEERAIAARLLAEEEAAAAAKLEASRPSPKPQPYVGV